MSFSLDQLLIFAARAGNVSLIEDRLAEGANPDYSDPLHGSAAMEAVRRGDVRILKLLLQAGLKPDSPAARDHGGLVEGALRHQQEHVAVLLKDHGFGLLAHARPIFRERLKEVLAKRSKVESPNASTSNTEAQ